MLEDQRLGVINNKNILAIEDNPDLPSGVSIGPQMVENFIKEVHISTIGEKTTLVRAVLVNGFEVIESSACVDKANYNENIGAEVCMKKIKDKIWFLLGFLLQSAVGGVK
nr:Gp49 family protein [Clostridium sp. BSD9I1]